MNLRALLKTAVVVGALGLFALEAYAATVETKIRLIVREKPTASARIVDRVAAGKKLPMLGKTPDGNWVHVKSGGKDGWVPAEGLKGMKTGGGEGDSGGGDDGEPGKPLAKRRSVRPEAWVSKSRYHDGEDTRLTVSAPQAEIYGRPSATGSVMGVLRRGEQVQLIKASADKKWLNVDIGGGETAWIEAKSVKPGGTSTAAVPEEAPATDTPATPQQTRLAKQETPSSAEEAPPPARTRSARDTEEEVPPGLAPAGKQRRGAEALPSDVEEDAKAKKRRRLAKMASGEENAEQVSAAPWSSAPSAEQAVVKDVWRVRGRVYLTPYARGGIAVLDQRFTSNGQGNLTNFQGSTAAFGAQVGMGLWGTAGTYFLYGVDANYAFAGGSSFRYAPASGGQAAVLATQAHTIDGSLSAGVHFGVAGGLSLRLRIGGQLILNIIDPAARLPSDRIAGLTIGLALAAPALFEINGHAIGVSAFGGALAPAQRAQSPGLEEGTSSSTFGAFFGGDLGIVLLNPNLSNYKGTLSLDFAYSYEFAATHFTGNASTTRNAGTTVPISSADRGTDQHLIVLGLGFNY
jgi:hypothetical protein